MNLHIKWLKWRKDRVALARIANTYALKASHDETWCRNESISRAACIALLELAGEFDEARLVRARDAMWQGAYRALKKGKMSCTEDALKSWDKVMHGPHKSRR